MILTNEERARWVQAYISGATNPDVSYRTAESTADLVVVHLRSCLAARTPKGEVQETPTPEQIAGKWNSVHASVLARQLSIASNSYHKAGHLAHADLLSDVAGFLVAANHRFSEDPKAGGGE